MKKNDILNIIKEAIDKKEKKILVIKLLLSRCIMTTMVTSRI